MKTQTIAAKKPDLSVKSNGAAGKAFVTPGMMYNKV